MYEYSENAIFFWYYDFAKKITFSVGTYQMAQIVQQGLSCV
jgi:hypothetical protein